MKCTFTFLSIISSVIEIEKSDGITLDSEPLNVEVIFIFGYILLM